VSAQATVQAQRQIAELLAAKAGMDPQTLEASRLRWIIGGRCRALGLADNAAYLPYLNASPFEIDTLIEQAIVPETRFFRDAAVFDHLRQWFTQAATPLRILSAPCSSGQEPYSLAATLQEAGVSADDFRITAVDLSAATLAVGELGLYPESAFHGVSAERKSACGQWNGTHWKMHVAWQHRIHFQQMNLAKPGVLGAEQYHLILCRNLFVYLHPQARQILARSLAAALLPEGRLILGTADHCEELDALFTPIKPAASFAYQHRSAKVVRVPLQRVETRKVATSSITRTATEAPRRLEVSAATLLSAALKHQQHGALLRAEHRCRQALYLDPGYMPALELLERLWAALPNQRLRCALAARIQRHRSGATVEEAP
jgi:chemotaxis protein methyltransferase WspC